MKDISQEIIDIFSKKLPKIFNSKEIRQNQVQMALDVADFLFKDNEKIMFVEAPVGTGKSLGLLIPTAMYLREKRIPTVYATATINLQNQILDKDSTVLESINLLSTREKILAQGKGNYICKTAFESNIDHFSEDEIEQIDKFFDNCNYGLFSELFALFPDFDTNKKAYLALDTIRDRECRDLYPARCPGHTHRSLYTTSTKKLVITNHDQLIQSYLNSQNDNPPIIKLDRRVIIVDEAHSLKETFLGRICKGFNFNELPRPKSNLVPKRLKQKYTKTWGNLKKLNQKFANSDGTESNVRLNLEIEDINNLEEIRNLLDDCITALVLQAETNRNSYRVEMDLQNLEELNDKITTFIQSSDKKWIEKNKGVSFQRVTKKFEEEFNHMLSYLSSSSKIIFMSGTLTTNQPEQDIRVDWGLTKDWYIYKKYTSTFDLKKQALVYIPKEAVHPNKEEYYHEHLYTMNRKLPELINLSLGGSLVLCTSNMYVREVTTALRKSHNINQKIFSQDDGDTQGISKSFKEDINSILVGSGSFFTGFSVEGEALNKLFLSKLPYPVHTDPYIELISKDYSDFESKRKKIIIPIMLKRLEQGLGRLIRSKTDYGLITIFDPRIKKGSGPYQFIEKLGYLITSDLEEVKEFVNSPKHQKNLQLIEQFDENKLQIPNILVGKKPRPKSNIIVQRYQNPTSRVSTKREIKPIKNSGIRSHRSNKPYTTAELQDWLIQFINSHGKKQINESDVSKYKKLKNSRAIYEKALEFCVDNELSYHLVALEFPFDNASQRQNFRFITPRGSRGS